MLFPIHRAAIVHDSMGYARYALHFNKKNEREARYRVSIVEKRAD